MTRKLGIFCKDPYATESSSDEDEPEVERFNKKRFIREITIADSPLPSSPNYDSDNYATQRSKKKRKLSSIYSITLPTTKNLEAVQRRNNGKWDAVIRDPLKKVPVWLGTYDTPEEAERAYEIKQLEFQARLVTENSNHNISPSSATSEKSSHLSSSTLSVLESDTTFSSGVNMVDDVLKEGFDTNIADLDTPFKMETLMPGPLEEEYSNMISDSDHNFFDTKEWVSILGEFCGINDRQVPELLNCDFDQKFGDLDFSFLEEEFFVNEQKNKS